MCSLYLALPYTYRPSTLHYVFTLPRSHLQVSSINLALCVHFTSLSPTCIGHQHSTIGSLCPALPYISSINFGLFVHFTSLSPTGIAHQPCPMCSLYLAIPYMYRSSTFYYWFALPCSPLHIVHQLWTICSLYPTIPYRYRPLTLPYVFTLPRYPLHVSVINILLLVRFALLSLTYRPSTLDYLFTLHRSLLQVSSINRVLRNLTTDTQKSPLCQSPIYDKFGLLNGQSWPRPSPWYTPGAHMHSIGMTAPYPTQPRTPTLPISEKKGELFVFGACVCVCGCVTCMRVPECVS